MRSITITTHRDFEELVHHLKQWLAPGHVFVPTESGNRIWMLLHENPSIWRKIDDPKLLRVCYDFCSNDDQKKLIAAKIFIQ